MPRPLIELLAPENINSIHETSVAILNKVGVIVHHQKVLEALAEAGAQIDFNERRAYFNESLVQSSLSKATKRYQLFGRDQKQIAYFGYGQRNLISGPGQFSWFEHGDHHRRDPLLKDIQDAIRVGDALTNISIVGAMGVPVDVPEPN